MKIKLLLGVLAAMSVFSCSDLLNKEPLDIIGDPNVWNDPNLVRSNLLDLYAKAPTRRMFSYGFAWGGDWDDGTAEPHPEPGAYSVITDESVSAYSWTDSYARNKQVLQRNDTYQKYWDYGLVRLCNEFIEKVEMGTISDKDKQIYKSEARFIRAFVYFEMVKRYGGVPIITRAQQITDPEEELYPSRNSEKDVYDFVISECDEISKILPEIADNSGRVTRYASLALLSRGALYAGSIAKYGSMQLDGLLGISPELASEYYQKSIEASTSILSGPFSLYNKHEDKATNYQMLFLDTESGNPEIIFSRQFIENDRGHSFDYFNVIQGQGSGWGSYLNPTLDLVEAYDMVDGSNGEIDWATMDMPLKEVLKNKDPRMHATICYDGCEYGDKYTVSDYIVETKVGGGYQLLDNAPGEFKDWMVGAETITLRNTGLDTYSSAKGDATKTGFYIKKFISFDNLRSQAKASGTDWIEFRLAEIMLNKAEALQERGEGGALELINEIRERAGVAAHTSIDIEKIRRERRVELAFEAHRLWDLNRWRVAENVLNTTLRGVVTIRRMPENEYRYQTFSCDNRSAGVYASPVERYFNPDRMYYLPLGEEICNNNAKIVENPNYE